MSFVMIGEMRWLMGLGFVFTLAVAGFGLAACGGGGSDETALGEDEARQLISSLFIDPVPSSLCRRLADLSMEDAAAPIEDVGDEAFRDAFRDAFEEAFGEAPDMRQYGEIIAEECERRSGAY